MQNNLRALTAVIMLGGSFAPLYAQATVVYDSVNQSFDSTPISFSFDGGTFTFSSSGDIFNPAAIETSKKAAVSSFGGFLGIPITPSTSFVDRGTVTYGSSTMFTNFPSTTTIPYSNGDNFLGLRVTKGGKDYYGFAFTTNTTLNSYGFETVAGKTITATTAVPEPATWALMFAGVSMMGLSLRDRRKRLLATA